MNNGDLIRREALKKDMCKMCNEDYSDEPCEPSDCVFFNAIKNAHAVDTVEVGNCEGCIWARRKRPQKCSCCRRNPDMKDCWEDGE